MNKRRKSYPSDVSNEERAFCLRYPQMGRLAQAIPAAADEPVRIAFVDPGCTGEQPTTAAAQKRIDMKVVKDHEAIHRSVLVPRCWEIERSFAWTARFRHPAQEL